VKPPTGIRQITERARNWARFAVSSVPSHPHLRIKYDSVAQDCKPEQEGTSAVPRRCGEAELALNFWHDNWCEWL